MVVLVEDKALARVLLHGGKRGRDTQAPPVSVSVWTPQQCRKRALECQNELKMVIDKLGKASQKVYTSRCAFFFTERIRVRRQSCRVQTKELELA